MNLDASQIARVVRAVKSEETPQAPKLPEVNSSVQEQAAGADRQWFKPYELEELREQFRKRYIPEVARYL